MTSHDPSPTSASDSTNNMVAAPPRRRRVRLTRRMLLWSALIPLIILSTVLINWAFLAQTFFVPPAASSSTPGHNTFNQFTGNGQQGTHPAGVLPATTSSGGQTGTQPQTFQPSAEPATMKPLTLTLSSTQTSASSVKAPGMQAQDLKGSDGRLEVLVPAGALYLSHATTAQGKAPTGTLRLQIVQQHGHFSSTFDMLGTYQFAVLDAAGQVVQGVTLRQPLTLIYHYQPQELQGLQLNPDHLFVSWPIAQPATGTAHTAPGQTTSIAGDPQSRAFPMVNNVQQQTLTAQVSGALITSTTTSGQPQSQVAPQGTSSQPSPLTSQM
ncbi:MAG: hypothetical protein ACRDHW_21840, partial [Ktedonobacteraceae bacterium]